MPQQHRNPDHYAIVIGIDGYSQLPRLRVAGKDATRFIEWLTSHEGGGLPPENVQAVLSPPELPSNNPLDARPIALEIDKALINIGTQIALDSRSRIGTRLYFYFAGHGFGPSFDDIGMLMATAYKGRFKHNVGLRQFRLFFRASALFSEVIFILDCCRDSIGGIETFGPGFDLPVGGAVDAKAVQDFVIVAAMYGEDAFQVPAGAAGERRGLLTEAVLEALQKPEAADALGRFTASALRDYVSERVPQLATEARLKQTPNFDPAILEKEIVFGTISSDQLPRVTVHIVAPPDLAGDLVLLDRGRTVERHRAANVTDQSPWVVQLVRSRWYAVAHTASGPDTPANIIDLRNVQDDPYTYVFKT